MNIRFRTLALPCSLLILAQAGCGGGNADPKPKIPIVTLKFYVNGTPASTPPPALQGPGWDIGGGGTDVDAAMAWLVTYVGGGSKIDIVVLRCDDPGIEGGYHPAWGPGGCLIPNVNACVEIVGRNPSDFNDSRVVNYINNAGAVFFAGGDQADYVKNIKGTLADTAVKNLVARGGGVGGTSDGTAIQGPFVFDSIAADADNDNEVASADALANPYESIISFTYGWYSWPNFNDILCDQHFGPTRPERSNKDRMGRLLTFLARQVQVDAVLGSADAADAGPGHDPLAEGPGEGLQVARRAARNGAPGMMGGQAQEPVVVEEPHQRGGGKGRHVHEAGGPHGPGHGVEVLGLEQLGKPAAGQVRASAI